MNTYIGIDLSWSGNNPTGIAVLRGDTAVFVDTVISDQGILSIIQQHVSARIAIDAPLVVPNQTGRRRAEAECQHLFGMHHAGAHPANRTILTQWSGVVRGEEVLTQLLAAGWVHDPTFQSNRSVAEVYPHAASIGLFGLEKILPYKARKNRTYEQRWDALKKLQELLGNHISFPQYSVDGNRGKRLKEIEDKLDALFCALIAQHAHTHPEKTIVMGSAEEGSITAFSKKV